MLTFTLATFADASVVEGILVFFVSETFFIVLDLLLRDEFVAVFSSPTWLRTHMRKVAKLAGSLREEHHPHIQTQLRNRFDEFIAELDDLSLGRFETSARQSGRMLDLTRESRTTILGITNIDTRNGKNDLQWWLGEMGEKYLEENARAVSRGLEVQRVVIYRTWDADLHTLLNRMAAAGVKLCVVESSDVPDVLRRNLAIWDDSIAWESRMDPYGSISQNLYRYGRSDVRKYLEMFRDVHNLAHRYEQKELPVETDRQS